jgi:hypothetical protein
MRWRRSRLKDQLPSLIQPTNSDVDMVLLLNEIDDLQQQNYAAYTLINEYRQKLDKAHEITRI